eukprot:216724-Chlamydomonas_euryale.AAC.2
MSNEILQDPTVAYSLGTRCLSELFGTFAAIYLGNSVVANVLLPGAKGQAMGFGFLSLGYGFSFFFPILWLGNIRCEEWLAGAFCGHFGCMLCTAAGQWHACTSQVLFHSWREKSLEGGREASRGWLRYHCCLSVERRPCGMTMRASSLRRLGCARAGLCNPPVATTKRA